MRIEIGKYILYSDRWSMWICEKHETKDKKTKKPTGNIVEQRITGYSTSLTRLLESFRATKVDGNDAENLEKLLEALRITFADMVDINTIAVEADFERIEDIKNGRQDL